MLNEKIEAVESTIKSIKAVQMQQETDISHIKEVIANQQRQIESYEEKERKCNLIISNMPENEVTVNNVSIDNDVEKIVALANLILPSDDKISRADIEETVRIGRRGGILKVRLSDVYCRNKILRSCRSLNSPAVLGSFGRLYVNKDMSYLRRCEEKRLRNECRRLKTLYPDAVVRIRNGNLLLGQGIKDCVDYRNQLF